MGGYRHQLCSTGASVVPCTVALVGIRNPGIITEGYIMKVFVYWNLHKNVWSVKHLEGVHKGLVMHHSPRVILKNAVPKVSEMGRQRVLREKRKNVHAGVVGEYLGDCYSCVPPEAVYGPWEDVSYNPYKGPSFYFKAHDGLLWTSDNTAPVAVMDNRRVMIC